MAADLNNVIQQIRDAQAEAIRQGYGVTINNPEVIQNKTQEILQRNLAQQKPANKDSGQAETSSSQKAEDTRTTQQKYEDAQKAHDDYTNSDGYKKNIAKAQKEFSDTQGEEFDGSRLWWDDGKKNQDTTEQALKATAEHYKQQMEREENRKIMDDDLKELESWTDDEKERLDDYMLYNSRTNPIMGVIAELKIAPMVKKYGQEKVNQMIESYGRHKNEVDTNAVLEKSAESAGKNPIAAAGHSLLSIGANLAGSVTAPLGFLEEATSPTRTGRYSTLDPNNLGYLPGAYSGAVRGQVTEDIKGDGESWLRNLAALGYQGGMSAADSAARIVASGGSAGISAALAASGSFGNSIRQYSQQGVSPERAAAMAVVNSGLEYVFEKLPTDEVLKLFKGGTTKATVGKILAQAFWVEPTSEEVSLFAGVAAEAAILGEKSDMRQKTAELVANGMSYEDAEKQCCMGLWKEAAETYAVSVISGGISATGAAVLGSAVNWNSTEGTGQEAAADTAVPQDAPAAESPSPAAPVTTAPDAAVADEGQQIVDAVAKELAQQATRQEKQSVSPEMEQLNAAIAETLGGQPEQQNTIDTAPIADNNSVIQPSLNASSGKEGVTDTSDKQAGSMDTSGAEGSTGEGAVHGGSTEPVQADAPGGQRGVSGGQGRVAGTGKTLQDDTGDAEYRRRAEAEFDRIAQRVAREKAPKKTGRKPKTGIGTPEINFSKKPNYNETLSEDNHQADRKDDVRPMELPKEDAKGGNVSAVTGNVYGSRITPDDFASLMEEPTAKGKFSYAKISNDEATKMATENIARAGTWENAYDKWKQEVGKGRAGAEMTARGALFLNRAAQQGDKRVWLENLSYMQKLGTNTSQGLQAFRIIRTLKADDKVAFTRIFIDDMVADLNQKRKKLDIKVDENLMTAFEKATTDEARDAAIGDIQQNIADQIPSTAMEMLDGARYLNMLGNLKTNVRNFAGNAGSTATYMFKDGIANILEYVRYTASGGKTDRTKSLLISKGLFKACAEDFQQFSEAVSAGGKYTDEVSAQTKFAQGVQDKRTIYRGILSPLEKYRKATNWTMNNKYFGDEGFGKFAYARALAGYLNANGVEGTDLSKVDTQLMDKARAYAIQQAQETTFHDNTALSKILSNIQKNTGVVGKGTMPFTKTPSNVLVRAEEFSPLGLINSTFKSIQKSRGNVEITGADIIDSWSKTMTGTALFALGAYMCSQGVLTGGPDEDKEQEAFDQMSGKQNYAIQLPNGKNYTLDWLTPASMTLFMGAEFQKAMSQDGEITFADLEKVLTSIANPIIKMSMLNGLSDTLENIKYADNNLLQLAMNGAMGYLTQMVSNSFLRQLESSFKENRKTTYIDKNSQVPDWMQRQLGKLSQSIPGWEYQQMDYRNAWGQVEKNKTGIAYNMLSPGYVSEETDNRVTRELNRLHEATGVNVFPQKVDKEVSYTDVNGETHIKEQLTMEQLDKMQEVTGQTALKLITEITGKDDYKSLTDAQKTEAIANVYKYAKEQGMKAAIEGYYSKADAWIQKMGDDPAGEIIRKSALSGVKSSVDDIVEKIGKDWAVSDAAKQELNDIWDSYDGMSDEAKKDILDKATSDTAKYLEIRSHGLDTEQYLGVVGDIKGLEVEPNYSEVRPIQVREAIAGSEGLSDNEKDIVMRAYLADYDPKAKKPQTSEVKYDAIREMGLSPKEYTDAYRVYMDASGKGKKSRTVSEFAKTYGLDKTTAGKLYDIYDGKYKPWEK